MILNMFDYDVIYLSYDEPNAEENYYDLKLKIPWAKRVHGVEGSDAAHKACAELSSTQRFITIDGDNKVSKDFLSTHVEIVEGVDIKKHVISWSGYNTINGLTYGNGGIKCWDKDTVLNMRTHENADPDNIQAQVDFCWDLEYIQIDKIMSTVYNNSTPQQAWRAGFREGVKMSLIDGARVDIETFKKVHWKNLHRLYVWLMVGADVENGLWAIYGAREGLYKTMCTDWDYVNVRDFEYLNNLWKEKIQTEDDLLEACIDYGERIVAELELPIDSNPLAPDQSKFFKTVYKSPPRQSHHYIEWQEAPIRQTNEYDIFMLTYNEPNGDENFEKLKSRFPRAQRVHGIKGIHNAHKQAAKICRTNMMWIVDGDAVIADDFNFDYVVENNDKDAVHVWRSKNPVNGLEYGYGGVKLLPTKETKIMRTDTTDMTTSISSKFKKMDQVSNITAFNTDPFTTWRSAFRECCKLGSKVIERQNDAETQNRLDVWTTYVNEDAPFAEYALAGARAGKQYGATNKNNEMRLRQINDFDWLLEKFNESE